jgi:hypothetical protein
MEDSAEELVSINQLLDTYFQGIYEGSIGMLYTVYHPCTLLFGDVKGQPYAKTLVLYLNGVAHRQSPKDSGTPFQWEILSVSVISSIAIAKVRVRMYDFNYHEFLSFHKIDNRWLIVNKMITDVPQ